ncbi:hypothetical protein AAF712_012620 [Marasmius tenuissimus]|uniref:RING-type domain-containing protein n=1 Tax=Marasmius tenuissimus TaxID=585030 RepID=A0ABR2ZG22_9AGAR
MANQCNICLSSLKEPVSIPCGHVYCADCLGEHVSTASQDGYTSSCPTCRTEFPIVTPERTCLPKQVLKFLFPTIRRVYIPDNSSEIEKLQNALNASQTGRQHLEDQVGHLMVQCERYMFTSAAHAKGEKDAMKEIGRLKRRLETEIEARQEAEEARDREIEKAAMLLAHLPVTPAGRNKAYSGATRVQRIQREDSSDDEAEEISTVSYVGKAGCEGTDLISLYRVGRNTHLLPVPERRRDDNLRASTSHSRLPAQSSEHVLDPRRQSQPSNQNPPASNPSPIHGATKRYIPISDSSDSDSDSDIIRHRFE